MKLKKWLMCLAMIAFVMIGTDVVFAADCNQYACATCVYEFTTVKFTYTIEADGVGGVSKGFSYQKLNSEDRRAYEIIDNSSDNNFISADNTKIECPNVLNYKINGSANTMAMTVDPSSFSGQVANPLSLSSESTNNGRLLLGNDPTATVEGISCDYEGRNTGTAGGTVSNVTIKVINGRLEMDASNGYSITNRGNVNVSTFQRENGEYYCPTLWVNCGSNNSNKFCTVSSEATSVIPGDTGQTGDETPNANENEEYTGWGSGDEIPTNCGLIGEDVLKIIRELYKMLMIAMPIALIIFGAIDFTTPLLSNDREALTKATGKFVKRCIILVVIFLAPTILQYILNVYSETTGKDVTMCGLIGTIIKNLR